MPYALIKDNQILFGPTGWAESAFGHILKDAGINANVPVRYTGSEPIVFGNGYSIVETPSLAMPVETIAQKIGGGSFSVVGGKVVGGYVLEDRTLDEAKTYLLGKITEKRLLEESTSIKVNVLGVDVTVSCAREERDIWVQTLFLLPDGVIQKFKFPEAWLEIGKPEIQLIVAGIMAQVQYAFSWEHKLVVLINAAESIADLESLDIRPKSQLLSEKNMLIAGAAAQSEIDKIDLLLSEV